MTNAIQKELSAIVQKHGYGKVVSNLATLALASWAGEDDDHKRSTGIGKIADILDAASGEIEALPPRMRNLGKVKAKK